MIQFKRRQMKRYLQLGHPRNRYQGHLHTMKASLALRFSFDLFQRGAFWMKVSLSSAVSIAITMPWQHEFCWTMS
jgi:hypothetical protein